MLHQHHKMSGCSITCRRLGKIFLKHYPHLVVLLQGGPVLTLFSRNLPTMHGIHPAALEKPENTHYAGLP